MEIGPDAAASAPMLVIGLGHYGRRLLWVLAHEQSLTGQADACILCPPQANGEVDRATLPVCGAVAAALVVADCGETNCAVRLHETARVLATGGMKAYTFLAEPAETVTGTRWAGEFAGSILLPYANNDEWRRVRAQMPDMIRAWAMPEGRQGLPDWQRLFTGAGSAAMNRSGDPLRAHAA